MRFSLSGENRRYSSRRILCFAHTSRPVRGSYAYIPSRIYRELTLEKVSVQIVGRRLYDPKDPTANTVYHMRLAYVMLLKADYVGALDMRSNKRVRISNAPAAQPPAAAPAPAQVTKSAAPEGARQCNQWYGFAAGSKKGKCSYGEGCIFKHD